MSSTTLESLATGNALLSSREIAARCATNYRRALKVACELVPQRSEDWHRFENLSTSEQFFFLRLTGARSAIDGVYIDGEPRLAEADWDRSIRNCLLSFQSTTKPSEPFDRWRIAGADLTRVLCPDFPYVLS